MWRPQIRLWWISVLMIAVAGCNDQPPEPRPQERPRLIGEPSATTNTPTQGANATLAQSVTLSEALAHASNDLRRHLGHGNFTTTSSVAVTWPDTSTGCPTPGHSYPQVLVPGYLIVFNSGAETYRYTGTVRSPPERCPASRFRPPLETHLDA